MLGIGVLMIANAIDNSDWTLSRLEHAGESHLLEVTE
jgi:hypothetical protein